jgi:hypothetical protein
VVQLQLVGWSQLLPGARAVPLLRRRSSNHSSSSHSLNQSLSMVASSKFTIYRFFFFEKKERGNHGKGRGNQEKVKGEVESEKMYLDWLVSGFCVFNLRLANFCIYYRFF